MEELLINGNMRGGDLRWLFSPTAKEDLLTRWRKGRGHPCAPTFAERGEPTRSWLSINWECGDPFFALFAEF